MPRIMDRYVLWQFVKTFMICFLSFTGLYIVVDLFNNLDSFLEFAESDGDLLGVVSSYYAHRSLMFFERTSGILILVAAVFTVTWLQRFNELTALMAAGIRRGRILAPILVAAIAISCLTAAEREFVLPVLRDQPGLGRNAQDLKGEQARTLAPKYDQKTDILLDGGAAYAGEQRIDQPRLRLSRPLDVHGPNLIAETAYFRPAEASRPSGYLLENVSEPRELLETPSLSLGEEKVVLTPMDTPWLKENQIFVVSDITFEQLAADWAWEQFASTGELIQGLHNPSIDFNAGVRVTVHARLVQPLLDINLLLLGLPVMLNRHNRNIFLAMGYCIGIAAMFLLVVIGCQQLGNASLLSPSFAAWAPLMLFVPVTMATSKSLWEWQDEPEEGKDSPRSRTTTRLTRPSRKHSHPAVGSPSS